MSVLQPAMKAKTWTGGMAIAAVAACVGAIAPPAVAEPTGRIVFGVSSRNADASSIYSVDAGGTRLRRLTSRHGLAGRPMVSPDATRIAFARGTRGQLWLMHDDGSNERRLTNGHKTKFAYGWSPNSRSLLFDAILNDNEEGDLRTVTRTGSIRNLTHTPARFAGASWSPDGGEIVYSKDVSGGGNYEIFTMDRNGSHNHRITHNPGLDIAPAWSSSGIVYEHHSAKRSRASLMLKRIGHRRKVLVTFRHSQPEQPRFSPNGERIAFLRCRGTVCPIYAIRPDGSALHRVTEIDGSGGYAWSPDSRYVAVAGFRTKPHTDNELYVCRTTGAGCTRVTRDRGDEFTPAWMP